MAVFNQSWRKVKTQLSNLEGNVNKIFILILGKNLYVDEFCQIKKQSIQSFVFGVLQAVCAYIQVHLKLECCEKVNFFL